MAVSYENYMYVGLLSGAKYRFEPMHDERPTNLSTYGHNRFHHYTSDVTNRQRKANESYFVSGYYPENYSYAINIPSETGIFIGGTYPTNNQQHYSENKQINYQWAFTPKCLQNLCRLNADTGTSLQNTPSPGGKDRSHPFYSRKRVEPAEGMTRTRDKYRVVYTEKQRRGLEEEYKINKFITIEIREKISEKLGLSARQIKIWFQNRRAKERRETKKDKFTNQTENCSTEDDNDTKTCFPSNLDNTDELLTSCRFTGNENLSEERHFSSRQCRFTNQTANRSISPSYTSSVMCCLFESRECLNDRPSISSSEWRMLAGSSFLPTDVSPLTCNVNFDFELRV